MQLLSSAAIFLSASAPLAPAPGHVNQLSKSTILITASVRTKVEATSSPKSFVHAGTRARTLLEHEFCVQTNSGTNRYLVRAERSGASTSLYKLNWRPRRGGDAILLDSGWSPDFSAGLPYTDCGINDVGTFSLDLKTDTVSTSSSSSNSVTLIFGSM